MTPIRIIFSGGGDEHDARPLDETLAGWVGKGRLLYLPVAQVDLHFIEAGVRWITATFAPLGLENITSWMSLAGKSPRDLAAFDAVYIGGGNTFYLLHQLRANRLAAALADFIRDGHPAYGGSAGALILARTITPCSHMDENIVGLRDMSGLNLALGWAVWCHSTLADDQRITLHWRRTRIPSVAVGERSGVVREGDRLYAAGYEPAYRLTGFEKEPVQPGERIA